MLLLLSGSRSAAAGATPVTAILLVARDALADPYFAKSVVLVMNDFGPGPVGIIINRPTSIRVSRLFPRIKRLARAPDTVYFGGPVQIGSLWFLFRARSAPAHAVRVLRGVYLSTNPGLLRRLLERPTPMRGLRVYAGHAGWAPGQLQGEIRMGFWKLKRADPAAIFNGVPDHSRPAPRVPQHGARPAFARRGRAGLLRIAVSSGASPRQRTLPGIVPGSGASAHP